MVETAGTHLVQRVFVIHAPDLQGALELVAVELM